LCIAAGVANEYILLKDSHTQWSTKHYTETSETRTTLTIRGNACVLYRKPVTISHCKYSTNYCMV